MDTIFILKVMAEVASVAATVWGVVNLKLRFLHESQKDLRRNVEYAHKRIDDHLVVHSHNRDGH